MTQDASRYYELKQELTELRSDTKVTDQEVRALAQLALDRATEARSWFQKLATVVLSAVVLAVLKETGVI